MFLIVNPVCGDRTAALTSTPENQAAHVDLRRIATEIAEWLFALSVLILAIESSLEPVGSPGLVQTIAQQVRMHGIVRQ